MGLLAHAPTEAELERLYYEIARIGGSSVGRKRPWSYRLESKEALIALAAELLRFDPRLLSILLQLLVRKWQSFNPVALRRQMHAMRWPQALAVVLEFVKEASSDAELRHFCDYLAAGWPRIEPAERFFLDAERPGSRMAARRMGRNLRPYARWGFVGSERPIADPATKRTVGRYDAPTRSQILSDLVERASELTLAEYLEAVDHGISRQQALLDLKRCPELVVIGRGRGAKWRKRRGAGHRASTPRQRSAKLRSTSRARGVSATTALAEHLRRTVRFG
jgi:hypothetical protein